MSPDLLERARDADRRLAFGEVGPLHAVLPALDAGGEQERLWADVLRAARADLDPEAAFTLDSAELERRLRAHPEPGARLAAVMARSSWLRQDFGGHEAWLAWLRELDAGGLELALREQWSAALRGEADAEAIEAVAARASDGQRGVILVEATALRALCALEDGDPSLATAKARRASRMARTEGAPHAEYLANLVLARLRRVNGRAHLAARILAALAEVAPPTWHLWLAWELLLAGSFAEGERLCAAAPGSAAAALAGVLEAAQRGDAVTFAAQGARLGERVAGAAWMRSDAESVLAALDPDADLAAAPEPVRAWCFGAVDDPPAGLHGLCSRPEDDESVGACVAWVLARPHEAPRRLLALALPLAVPPERRDALRRDTRQQARADTAIAVLTLAGTAGLDDEAFFRATYGFDYVPGQHRGVFDVLKHRMRKQLGGYSKLQREGERNVLDHGGLAVVPDPRCCQPLSDVVLRALAAGSATAKDLARRLQIPLRTAQMALKQLVEEGACMSTRQGRRIHYVLEDTTFSEPTRH